VISSAHAQPVKPQLIPECKVFATRTHGEVCGYTKMADVAELYKLDAELVLRRAEVELLKQKVAELIKQRDNYKIALDAERRAAQIIRDRMAALTKQLIETDRKLQLALVRPRWGTGLSWGIAAAAVGVLLGVVTEKVVR
jgi:transcriptional antiterminator Rof (Rho-off)